MICARPDHGGGTVDEEGRLLDDGVDDPSRGEDFTLLDGLGGEDSGLWTASIRQQDP